MISKKFFKKLRLLSLAFQIKQRLSILDNKDRYFRCKYDQLSRFSPSKFKDNFDGYHINGILSHSKIFDFDNGEICLFESKFILNQYYLMKFRRTRKKQLFEEFAKTNNLHHEN